MHLFSKYKIMFAEHISNYLTAVNWCSWSLRNLGKMSHPAISSAPDLTDPLTPALMLRAQSIGSSAADSLQLQAQSLHSGNLALFLLEKLDSHFWELSSCGGEKHLSLHALIVFKVVLDLTNLKVTASISDSAAAQQNAASAAGRRCGVVSGPRSARQHHAAGRGSRQHGTNAARSLSLAFSLARPHTHDLSLSVSPLLLPPLSRSVFLSFLLALHLPTPVCLCLCLTD